MKVTELNAVVSNYLFSNNGNLFADGIYIKIFGKNVQVESIWYNDDEDKYYIHCGCMEFEGDLDINSLSDKNQKSLMKAICKLNTGNLQKQ